MSAPRNSGPLIGGLRQVLEAFFRLEAASSLALVAAAVAAVAWANSPWASGLTRLEHLELGGLLPGDRHLGLAHVVNDGLMTLFFLLVGLEIKRELAVGELSTPRQAALPALAALGGMLAPAGIYLAFNHGSGSANGWGIPMATDIAFSIGCVRLLPGRVARGMVVFLTALAIFDDLGGIAVIALFYGTGIQPGWLLGAILVAGALAAWNKLGRPHAAVDTAALITLWLLLHHAGVHPTLSGVAVGLAVRADGRQLPRYERWLHPVVAFGIVPLFALLNAGVPLEGLGVADLLHPVAVGVALGLVVGKQVGIFGVTALAVGLKVAPMPGKASLLQLWAVSAIAGIGFTVALFVAALAFSQGAGSGTGLLERAKLGILAGSAAAALLGVGIIRFGVPRAQA